MIGKQDPRYNFIESNQSIIHAAERTLLLGGHQVDMIRALLTVLQETSDSDTYICAIQAKLDQLEAAMSTLTQVYLVVSRL